MKFLRSFIILLMAAAAVSVVSCKDKEDDSSTKEYLTGNISFDFPAYVQYGDVIHVVPSAVYKGSEKTDSLVAYRWVDPFTGVADTLRKEGEPAGKTKEFDFTMSKDTLGNFTLIVSAWADGYYEKTTSAAFTAVNCTFAFNGDGVSGAVTLPPGLSGAFLWRGRETPLSPGMNEIAEH